MIYRVQRRCEPQVTEAGRQSGLTFHPMTMSLWTRDKAKADRMLAELPERTIVTAYEDHEAETILDAKRRADS